MKINLGDELIKKIRDSKLNETHLYDYAGNKVLVSTRDIEPGDKAVFLQSSGKVFSKGDKSFLSLTVKSIHGPPGHERIKFIERIGSFAKYCCFQTYE